MKIDDKEILKILDEFSDLVKDQLDENSTPSELKDLIKLFEKSKEDLKTIVKVEVIKSPKKNKEIKISEEDSSSDINARLQLYQMFNMPSVEDFKKGKSNDNFIN